MTFVVSHREIVTQTGVNCLRTWGAPLGEQTHDGSVHRFGILPRVYFDLPIELSAVKHDHVFSVQKLEFSLLEVTGDAEQLVWSLFRSN